MTRDMDLVRKILLALEQKEPPTTTEFLRIDDYPSDIVAQHCEMMYQHGLIQQFNAQKTFGGFGLWEVGGITWEGYDYLDSIRDDSIWAKTKDAIKKKGLPMIVDTIKTVSSAFITSAANGLAQAIIKNGGVI